MTNSDPKSKTAKDVLRDFTQEADATFREMGYGLKQAAQGTATLATGIAREAYIRGTEFAFDAVDFVEAAGSNIDHKLLPKSGKSAGPLLIIGGAALAVGGIKVVAAIGGYKAAAAGFVATKAGLLTVYRGFRAVRPYRGGQRNQDAPNPPTA